MRPPVPTEIVLIEDRTARLAHSALPGAPVLPDGPSRTARLTRSGRAALADVLRWTSRAVRVGARGIRR